ncbi:MAG: GAF domain-containing protein [Haloarculaceae archaeon]
MTELTVLCVDPDEGDRDATSRALGAEGYEVVGRSSLGAAVDALGRSIDCVVTEYALPDGTGLDLAARVRETAPDTPCVLFTDESPDRIDTDRRDGVVVEYLPKDMPDAASSLVRLVGNVVAQRTQVGYPLPPDEDERLAVLEQYDRPDLATAAAFDRLTALARSHFGVDVAFVGLVDAHEERFLACEGADWETLSREDSMCTHTILEDDVMVVEDVAADARFADNERLPELDIAAYAGVPLSTPRGATIGAFCLTHGEPRSFGDAELADLRRFADEAMEQLELRRRLADRDVDDAGDERAGADGAGEDSTGGADGVDEDRTGGDRA